MYIRPHENIDQNILESLQNQLHKPFTPMGDLTIIIPLRNERKQIEKVEPNGNLLLTTNYVLFLKKQKTPTHINPENGSLSMINVTICEVTVYLNFSKQEHENMCDNDHFLIIHENKEVISEDSPRWKWKKTIYEKKFYICKGEMTRKNWNSSEKSTES